MMTLEDYLAQDAQRYPEKTAVICGEERLSYAQLWARVQQRAADFPRGKVVAFRSSQTVQFLIDYLAIHQAGSVAAPLEKGWQCGSAVGERHARAPLCRGGRLSVIV